MQKIKRQSKSFEPVGGPIAANYMSPLFLANLEVYRGKKKNPFISDCDSNMHSEMSGQDFGFF